MPATGSSEMKPSLVSVEVWWTETEIKEFYRKRKKKKKKKNNKEIKTLKQNSPLNHWVTYREKLPFTLTLIQYIQLIFPQSSCFLGKIYFLAQTTKAGGPMLPPVVSW